MPIKEYLEIGANVSAIATAVVAVWAGVRFKRKRCQKYKRLENYLIDKRKEASGTDKDGLHTSTNISRNTGLSEAEIFDLSSEHPENIELKVKPNAAGLAGEILFGYKGTIPK